VVERALLGKHVVIECWIAPRDVVPEEFGTTAITTQEV
jgi:hypothetical protein